MGLNKEGDRLRYNAGSFFWVNRSGLPLKPDTLERMWQFAAKQHPEGENMIERVRVPHRYLPLVPIPAKNFKSNMPAIQKIYEIQKYMQALEYNYTGTQFFHIQKSKPLCFLMETAKEIMKECLPIKCLEAVILAVYLTNGIPNLERFTIGFRTTFKSAEYRHVVLGVCYKGVYGALGMSRRKKLMFKPIIYKSLHELLENFIESYSDYYHGMLRIYIGLPITHDGSSGKTIVWKGIGINMQELDSNDFLKKVQRHSRVMKRTAWQFRNAHKSNSILPKQLTHKPQTKKRHKTRRIKKH